MAKKKISLKIKSSEKQKCVNKLFLSKSKILKRLDHRIAENLQNCNKKIRFCSNFFRKNCFSMVFKVSTEQCILNTLEYTTKKGT